MPNNKIQSLTVEGVTYDIVDNTSGYAKTNSPNFTGTPTAPTASSGDSSTQVATTAFVQDAVSGAGSGTVTSVGISNDSNGGLSVSGSPITSSGTITLGHSNVLSSAQTTQAVYPIKIDKNGHISKYGSAVTIPTKVSQLTNDSGYITSYTETDPVFSASAAAGITSTDINNWNAKVSDDKTWNGVGLGAGLIQTANDLYVPANSDDTVGSGTMYHLTMTHTPTSQAGVKYDADAYLYSTTPSASDNSTKVATTAYVDSAITALPEPMIFKGSLGTGGTITSLPTASSLNEGFTYKVITDGTYASQTAKVGDTFISDGNNWILIPSGDEPSGTVTSITAGVGLTTADGNPITSSGTIKTKLNSETSLGTIGSTSKLYAVGVDSNGQLGVKVPWANDQVYTIKSSSSYVDMFLTGSTSSDTSTGYLYKDPSARLKVSDSSGETGLFLGDDITEGEKLGAIYLYSQSGIYTRLTALATTMVKYISLPDKTGIIALTDDIPSISLNGSSTTSASFYAPTTAGTSGYYLKSNGSGAPTWAAIPAGVTVTLNGSTTTTPSFYAPTTAGTSGQVLTSSGSGAPTWSAITVPTKTSDLTNDSGFITGMTILSYGSSTWQNFIDAYDANKVVYCRASSNSNPASGSQTRLAFMAYVNNATTPTEVEFQYYRSVSTHTASQQGDQVYVYKLNKTNGWSVTVREASVKVVAGTGLSGTYSNGTMTLTGPTISLNGSSTTSASFYAPTTAGTSGYVLTSSGSGAPTWAEVSTSDTKVTQTVISDSSSNKKGLLLSNGDGSSTLTSTSYTSATLQYQPSTRTLSLREYGNPLTPGANLFLSYDTITFAGENFNTDLKQALNPNSHRTIYLPNADGTLALTSDIPTVPTISLNGTSTTSPSFYAPTTAGTSGYYLKSNGSGAPSWTSFPTIINTRGTPTSGGTTLSVVNTGDMYTWNNKSQVQIVTWSEE